MNVWLKRMVVLCGIVAFTVVGLTALDKHDERTCRQNPALAPWRGYDPPIPVTDLTPAPDVPVELTPGGALPSVPEICDGFLPW